ncbi:MAG: ATP-binding protein [Actinobacteria bacterium]|nr:ATP-binding protein [Actinomycetota bacterium]
MNFDTEAAAIEKKSLDGTGLGLYLRPFLKRNFVPKAPSLENPALIGEDGSRRRHLVLQKWAVYWRFVIILQIPVMSIFCPERLGSVSWALFVFTSAALYTAIYAYMAIVSKRSANKYFHLIDLLVCASLMIMAREPKLIYISSMYAYSTLIAFPKRRFSEAFATTFFLSFAYLGAQWLWVQTPRQLLGSPNELGSFVIFYFFGLGSVAFAGILERVSNLELAGILNKERMLFRAWLHDDLGSIVCGLCLWSEGVAEKSADEIKNALNQLSEGAKLASVTIKRLFSDLESSENKDLTAILSELSESFKPNDMTIHLVSNDKSIKLAPELQREIFFLVREAVRNAAAHSLAKEITIKIIYHRKHLMIEVNDEGRGFGPEELQRKQTQGSQGIKLLKERASRIGGKASVESIPGKGTSVKFSFLKVHQGKLQNRLKLKGGGIFSLLILIQALMLGLVLIQMMLLPPYQRFSAAALIISGVLSLDCIAWVIFRLRLSIAFQNFPVFLIIKQSLFAVLFVVALQAGLPIYFSLYIGVSFLISSLFLGFFGNSLAGGLFVLGTFLAYYFGPSPFEGKAVEDFITFSTSLWLTAASAGLGAEFLTSLEALKEKTSRTASNEEKYRLASDALKQLEGLIARLTSEIHILQKSKPDKSALDQITEGTLNLKNQLRLQLNLLQDQAEA